jgi:hypothetical protein
LRTPAPFIPYNAEKREDFRDKVRKHFNQIEDEEEVKFSKSKTDALASSNGAFTEDMDEILSI